MTSSPRLALPYIETGQAQKEVTHNEALNVLDVLAQIAVESTVTAPPSAPADGQAWIVGANATGAWAGQDGKIASYYQGWQFLAPQEGWLAWDRSLDQIAVYLNNAWVPMFGLSTGVFRSLAGSVLLGDTSGGLALGGTYVGFKSADGGDRFRAGKLGVDNRLLFDLYDNAGGSSLVVRKADGTTVFAVNSSGAVTLGSALPVNQGGTGATTAAAARTNLGLGSVDNTSDANKPVSTAQQAAFDLKASKANAALTGVPVAPTATATDNSTQLATTAFVQAVITNLIAMAPGTLDTLNELATAIGNDPNFAGTVTTALAGRLVKANNLSDLTNLATARTNLGLGTAATYSTGVSGGTVPLLNGANSWSAGQTFGSVTISNTLSDFKIGGAASSARYTSFDNFGRITSRYDDNSAGGMLLNGQNYGLTAAGQGFTLEQVQFGTGGVLGGVAFSSVVSNTDTWAAAANRSTQWRVSMMFNGNITNVITVNSSGLTFFGNVNAPSASFNAPTAQIPTLSSPWSNLGNGFQTVRYFISPDKKVTIEGIIQAASGSSTTDVTLFTLPLGFRPAAHMLFGVSTSEGARRIDVNSDGSVIMRSGSTGFTSLSGISFYAA